MRVAPDPIYTMNAWRNAFDRQPSPLPSLRTVILGHFLFFSFLFKKISENFSESLEGVTCKNTDTILSSKIEDKVRTFEIQFTDIEKRAMR